MFKNISTVTLIGILVVLAGIYFAFQFFGGKTRSKSLREELVEVDTAKVSRMVVVKGQESLELRKENDTWKVTLKNDKHADAQQSSVKSLMNNLLRIKPSRMVAKNPEKWSEYQVDTAGTRIKVYEGEQVTLDLVVGRFGMNQQAMQQQQMMGGRGGMGQFYTYVRLSDDDETYVADDFMGMSLGTNSADYRNSQILNSLKDSVYQVSFQYPDSSFVLEKVDTLWLAGQSLADSLSAVNYVNGLGYVSSRAFVDDVEPAALTTATLSITVKQNGKPDVTVKAFPHPIYKWIMNSSANPDSYFADEAAFEKLFVGKQQLLGS